MIRLTLPPGLDREFYRREIEEASSRVVRWFEGHGLAVAPEPVDAAVVLVERRADFPETFSGTVEGKTLLLMREEVYEAIHRRIYPEQPWTGRSYGRLISHEIAHRVHADLALAIYGTEDGMGPRWFFEGLAVVCAGQFQGDAPLSWSEIEELLPRDQRYPTYGRIVRSLASRLSIRWLIEHAGRPDFLEALTPDTD